VNNKKAERVEMEKKAAGQSNLVGSAFNNSGRNHVAVAPRPSDLDTETGKRLGDPSFLAAGSQEQEPGVESRPRMTYCTLL